MKFAKLTEQQFLYLFNTLGECPHKVVSNAVDMLKTLSWVDEPGGILPPKDLKNVPAA